MAKGDRSDRAARFGLRRAMVRDWSARRMRYLKRLGYFVASERETLRESLADVVAAARAQGEIMSTSQLHRLEVLRDLDPNADMPRKEISLFSVMFFCYYCGLTLADLEQFMLTGDEAALAPSERASLNALRNSYQMLSPIRRREVEQFMQFMLDQEQLEQSYQSDATPAPMAATTQEQARSQVALGASHAELDNAGRSLRNEDAKIARGSGA